MKKVIATIAILFTFCLAISVCITQPNAAADEWRIPLETQNEIVTKAPVHCVVLSEETVSHDIVTSFDETTDEISDETSDIPVITTDEIVETVNDSANNDLVETTTTANTVTETPVVHKCDHFWRTEYIPETRTESGCLFNSCLHCGEMYIVQIIPALSATE